MFFFLLVFLQFSLEVKNAIQPISMSQKTRNLVTKLILVFITLQFRVTGVLLIVVVDPFVKAYNYL